MFHRHACSNTRVTQDTRSNRSAGSTGVFTLAPSPPILHRYVRLLTSRDTMGGRPLPLSPSSIDSARRWSQGSAPEGTPTNRRRAGVNRPLPSPPRRAGVTLSQGRWASGRNNGTGHAHAHAHTKDGSKGRSQANRSTNTSSDAGAP